VASLCDARDLSEGPEVITHAAAPTPELLRKQLGTLIEQWEDQGLCQAEDVLVLHARATLKQSVLGETEWLGPYRAAPVGSEGHGARVCSIHRAKGLDAKAVILVGLSSGDHKELNAYERNTYFMGASRARQLLAIVV